MTIHESAEDYLEAILILHQRNGSVRSIDIAEELSVSKPSVSVAMKKLRTDSYIEMDDMGLITLLPKGQEIAQRIYERHTFLEAWLMRLGVSSTTSTLRLSPPFRSMYLPRWTNTAQNKRSFKAPPD